METIRIYIDAYRHYKFIVNENGNLIEKHLIDFFGSNNSCTASQAIKKIMGKHALCKDEIIPKIHRTKNGK